MTITGQLGAVAPYRAIAGETKYFIVTINSSAPTCRVTGVTGEDGDHRAVAITNLDANIYSFTMPDSDVSICVTAVMDSPGPTPDPTPAPATAPSHTHEWIEGVIYAATQYKDGLGGIYCKSCGAVKESYPISAFEYALNDYATPMINAAKSGQTITFEFGEWNSFPKEFMAKLVDKSAQNVTFVFHYNWNHVKQEINIPAGTPIDLNFDWYGPAKMAELYGAN